MSTRIVKIACTNWLNLSLLLRIQEVQLSQIGGIFCAKNEISSAGWVCTATGRKFNNVSRPIITGQYTWIEYVVGSCFSIPPAFLYHCRTANCVWNGPFYRSFL
ncbi:hypothetical protein [Terribacillus sp. AE2B 122]|nr:hypothetical protein [Terribacillus sp. AE2B 122]